MASSIVTTPHVLRQQFAAACKCGNVAEVQRLLGLDGEQAIDIKAQGPVALRDACAFGHLGVVLALLALSGTRAVNVHAGAGKPLMRACEGGHTLIVQELLALKGERCMHRYMHEGKPLLLAASCGSVELVEMLLRQVPLYTPLDTPTAREHLKAALAAACDTKTDNADMVAVLLNAYPVEGGCAGEGGIDPQSASLMAACKAGLAETAKVMLAHMRVSDETVRRCVLIAVSPKQPQPAVLQVLLSTPAAAAAIDSATLLRAYQFAIAVGHGLLCSTLSGAIEARGLAWGDVSGRGVRALWRCVQVVASSGLAVPLRAQVLDALGWPPLPKAVFPSLAAGCSPVRSAPPSSARAFLRCDACTAMMAWLVRTALKHAGSIHSAEPEPDVAVLWLRSAVREAAWRGCRAEGNAVLTRAVGRRHVVLFRKATRTV